MGQGCRYFFFPQEAPYWLWVCLALCRYRGSKDLGKEPSVGSGLVLDGGQPRSFPPSWPRSFPGPQLLLGGTLSKCPGAIWSRGVPISGKEALSLLYISKIEVSLSLCLGDLCSQTLPPDLALKGKVFTEVGPRKTMQIMWAEQQEA